MQRAGERIHIVVLGGGFGGAYAAHELTKKLPPNIDLTVIDRVDYLLFYPLLVEAGVGSVEPRHVVVPLRRFVRDSQFIMAEVTAVDLGEQTVSYQVMNGDAKTIHYDHLVLAMGSVTRMPPVPGLKEFGFTLKSLGDAVELRDRAISLLELANTITDKKRRRDLLRFVVVGGNFTGVEFAGEYQAFLMQAVKDYRNVDKDDVEMIILEHGTRILPAVRPELSTWAEETLLKRGVDIRHGNSITSLSEHSAEQVSGGTIQTGTVVWAAGIAPNPLVSSIAGLPINVKGYIDCEPDLRIKGYENVWSVGDSATVYASTGKPYPATAQTATRQGKLVAKNIVSVVNGGKAQPFIYKDLGSFAAIGHRSAAADVMGKNVKGFLGWVLYRGAYLFKMPTLALKARLGADWFLELILPTQPVPLGVRCRHKHKV